MGDIKLLSYANVYKITNSINNLIYVGCSTQELNIRYNSHKCRAKTNDTKIYEAMRNIGILNFKIELIEEYKDITKRHLLEQEEKYIRLFNTVECGYNMKYSNYNPLCIHNKQKDTCKICKGNRICEHNKYINNCILCDGTNLCEHKKIKGTCKSCNSIKCEHCNLILGCKTTLKRHQLTCNNHELCEHKIQKRKCEECNYKECECGQRFNTNYGLTRHKKTCADKTIKCKCGASFKEQKGLKRHLREKCKL